MTVKQREPEVSFQQPHHLAHRRLSDIQLLRCCLEAAMSSSRFEGSQAVQGGHLARHQYPKLKFG